MAEQRDENGVYIGPDEVTITLRTPVPRKGTDELTLIKLQEPTARQLSRYLAKVNTTTDDGIEALMALIGDVSGESPGDIEKLKQRDLEACGEFLLVFTKVPPKKVSAS